MQCYSAAQPEPEVARCDNLPGILRSYQLAVLSGVPSSEEILCWGDVGLYHHEYYSLSEISLVSWGKLPIRTTTNGFFSWTKSPTVSGTWSSTDGCKGKTGVPLAPSKQLRPMCWKCCACKVVPVGWHLGGKDHTEKEERKE